MGKTRYNRRTISKSNNQKVLTKMDSGQTDLVRIDAANPQADIIARAAAILEAGEVVVFPTETVYGLGANALYPPAIERIFAAKGRPFSDPLIVHIADEEDLEQLVEYVPEQARKLARVFWPGPLTLILPASSHVPKMITAGLPTVAVRMPRHPVAQALIRAVGFPIAAPSANRFMHVSPTTAQHAYVDLQGRVPLILDGGSCEVGVESTIVDMSQETPVLLRPGGVSLEALHKVVPAVQLHKIAAKREASDNGEELAQKAPGQMSIHYAPAVPTLLFDGTVEQMRAAMLAEVHRRRERGEEIGVLIADEDLEAFQESGARTCTLGNAATPEQIAGRLFAGLRMLEEAGVQVILCRNFGERGLGLAVRDRLFKASGGNIITNLG